MERSTGLILAGTAIGAAAAGTAVAIKRNRDHNAALEAADRSPWEDLPSRQQTITTTDGALLMTLESGPDNGPTVVLAHCWTGSRHTWTPVTRRLVSLGYHVIRWEQRGHGQSRPGTAPNSVRTLANDLSAVTQHYDVQDAVLAGHSLGGMTSMAMAAYHREEFHNRFRGLVLVDTAAAGLDHPLSRLGPTATSQEWVDQLATNPAFGRVLVRPTFGTWAAADHITQSANDFINTSTKVRSDIAAEFPRLDLREGISRIQLPTHIIVGSLDALTPVHLARQMHHLIPASQLQVLPGKGHMTPYEDANAVAAGIRRLVESN